MTPEDAEEYTAALAQVGAGWWRQRVLAIRLGVPEALGQTVVEWAQGLGTGVRLGIPERREAVLALTDDPEHGGLDLTNREAAAVLGIGSGTVWRDQQPDPNGSGHADDQEGEEPGLDPNGSREDTQPEEESEAVTECAEEDTAPTLAAHADPDNQEPDDIDDEPQPRATNGVHQPTLGESLPPDLELPPGELSPIQKAASAISRTHVVTKFSPEDMADAVIEMEALTDDPDYASQHLEKSRELAAWLEEMTQALNQHLSGPRLRVVSEK